MTTVSFLRDSDHLYWIEGYPHHGYWTGTTADGSQVLVVILAPHIIAIFFDHEGNLLEVQERRLSPSTLAMAEKGIYAGFRRQSDEDVSSWLDSLGIHESVIKVKRFFLPDYHVGIVDFPQFFQDILRNPSAYSEDEQRGAESAKARWFKEGIFELWLNDGTNLWITSTGQVESS
jgi:hypothetical protein